MIKKDLFDSEGNHVAVVFIRKRTARAKVKYLNGIEPVYHLSLLEVPNFKSERGLYYENETFQR